MSASVVDTVNFQSLPGESNEAFPSDTASNRTGFSEIEARATAVHVLRLRMAARSYFVPSSMSEPAWTLMLSLYTFGRTGRTSVASMAKRAALPPTTASRWLRQLHRDGYINLLSDGRDKRALRVALTTAGSEAMNRTFVAAQFITK